jgi:hypothetical protein
MLRNSSKNRFRSSYKRKNTKRNATTKKRRYIKKRYTGGNFGGHCPDPNNHSIYNSNMLKLFPYKP